ncbi:MAG: ABC transporter ATP-binding protein [Emergencia sp.]|jgi:peptide/nickel transport system ATP-binding protein|uniref:ABC transporter ATP-binding protein n=1 Tax=Anaerotruncus colihominis TaxID=169435 RepID=A0A845QGU0_9FIRM|nr:MULTISPECIES: ABC transporter ATP-binding protein [Eubacteriales]MCI9476381.1 ABC transporter ATP-binding protein [Emergencia sp.]NBH60646.1 ABC transporter ATP-binding protein [Anaerotruncus colihominis]NCF01300.1 ABC transporter ATP-binding protein [Anaerotruncus sp. 80]
MGTPLIETKHLKKYFKTGSGMLHAVDDVNISIERGHTLGVVGESGCGKSTLGRTILRLLPATSGSVLYEGKDIQKLGASDMKKMRSEMQIIFQDPYASLNPRMSVSQIIEEPLKVNHIYKDKAAKDQRILELMDTVGLARRLANSYPHELDGGRRQRIGVARALALNPSFIVCDEPVSALDVSIQAQVLNLMMDLQDSMGLTYMFITHDLSVVRHISTHIAVMYLGQVVEYAPSQELFDDPKHPYTKALLSAIPIPDLAYRGKPRELIKGEITSPIDPKPGCRFATRCPYATEKCTGRNLELTNVGSEHQVACVLYEE